MQLNRSAAALPENQVLEDDALVSRVVAGETALYEILMRRHNQRLYRVARAILKNDTEAEDVIQDAYVRAFEKLDQYAGEARFSTWLTRIAVHECLGRLRKQKRLTALEGMKDKDDLKIMKSPVNDPEVQMLATETRSMLEGEIDLLPKIYRAVFVLREVEEMSTLDTAIALGISEMAVKTRLHRARALLRKRIYRRMGTTTRRVFPFGAAHCDRVVEAVLARIAK